jgi:hypothetical protein
MSLANIDRRLVATLQGIRDGHWSYVRGIAPANNPLASLALDLGHPPVWAEPGLLPAFGGPTAIARWVELGVAGRGAVGGIPCEIVHGTVTGGSCSKNVALRGLYAFLEAVALYLPVSLRPTRQFVPSRRMPGPLPPHTRHQPALAAQASQNPQPAARYAPQRVFPRGLRILHLGVRLPDAHGPACAPASLRLARLLGRAIRVHHGRLPRVRQQHMD